MNNVHFYLIAGGPYKVSAWGEFLYYTVEFMDLI
jgi:hypothetical protein